MKRLLAVVAQQPASASPAPQQNPVKMTNDDVIEMAGLGLSDAVLIDKINAAPATDFDTSLTGLKALKAAKISDLVIRAMINPQSSGNASAPPPPPSSAVNEAVTAAATAIPPPPAQQAVPQPPPPPFHSTDGYVRMYVTDHPIDETISMLRASSYSSSSGSMHASGSGMSASGSEQSSSSAGAISNHQAGDDPRTVEIQADVQKLCSAYIKVSSTADRADVILVFRRQGGKRSGFFAMGGLTGLAISAASKVDGAALFENTGDMIYATKQTTVEKSIKDICIHIPPPAGTAPQVAVAPPPAPPASAPPAK
jgi:hypothetical protein